MLISLFILFNLYLFYNIELLLHSHLDGMFLTSFYLLKPKEPFGTNLIKIELLWGILVFTVMKRGDEWSHCFYIFSKIGQHQIILVMVKISI